ncbi:Scr1 family TA system antitoxin-like transcriptional regulator [Streptomyces sp. NPDC090493]|uniref:Scr1 family TA system antitoxin-like transcriptional regulator n=1 Tax=Streptomyces sp. NPDC090493 TaxID=3365964 RepID=UPI0037FBCB28
MQQLERLLDGAAERHITVQVLPFDQGGHEAMGGSLTILTLPDSSDVAYTEGSDYGQLIEEPPNVGRYKVIYDRLRAAALPPPPAHVTRHDQVRDGGQLPWRERSVPI